MPDKNVLFRVPQRRHKLVRRLAGAIVSRGSPRLAMSGFVIVATLAGFLASCLLRFVGLQEMSLRYALAVGCAYLAFLGSLSTYVAAYRARSRRLAAGRDISVGGDLVEAAADPQLVTAGMELSSRSANGSSDGGAARGLLAEAPEAPAQGSKSNASGGVDLDFGQADAVVLVVIGLILVAILSAVYASVLIVFQAPILLAEVLADGVLLAGLSRRFKPGDVEHWTTGAVRRTWKSALFVALVFLAVGLVLQLLVPDATTMSEAFWMALSRRGNSTP